MPLIRSNKAVDRREDRRDDRKEDRIDNRIERREDRYITLLTAQWVEKSRTERMSVHDHPS